jgi:hypothetical protein
MLAREAAFTGLNAFAASRVKSDQDLVGNEIANGIGRIAGNVLAQSPGFHSLLQTASAPLNRLDRAVTGFIGDTAHSLSEQVSGGMDAMALMFGINTAGDSLTNSALEQARGAEGGGGMFSLAAAGFGGSALNKAAYLAQRRQEGAIIAAGDGPGIVIMGGNGVTTEPLSTDATTPPTIPVGPWRDGSGYASSPGDSLLTQIGWGQQFNAVTGQMESVAGGVVGSSDIANSLGDSENKILALTIRREADKGNPTGEPDPKLKLIADIYDVKRLLFKADSTVADILGVAREKYLVDQGYLQNEEAVWNKTTVQKEVLDRAAEIEDFYKHGKPPSFFNPISSVSAAVDIISSAVDDKQYAANKKAFQFFTGSAIGYFINGAGVATGTLPITEAISVSISARTDNALGLVYNDLNPIDTSSFDQTQARLTPSLSAYVLGQHIDQNASTGSIPVTTGKAATNISFDQLINYGNTQNDEWATIIRQNATLQSWATNNRR